MGAKISASRINEKIRQYANEFVLWQNAQTGYKLEKEGELYMKCTACGVRSIVKAKI